jgi:glycosyltransferase involved in cell wall biosynthesis
MVEDIHVSVVVSPADFQEGFEQCLSALVHQDLEPAFEILVVDPTSDESLKALVEDYARLKIAYFNFSIEEDSPSDPSVMENSEAGIKQGPELRYLPVDSELGKANILNTAWQQTRGDIIAFITCDFQPAADWLDHEISNVRTNNLENAGQKTILDNPELPKFSDKNTNTNLFFLRSELESIGGFNED